MKHALLILILLLFMPGCSSKRTTSPIVVPVQTATTTRTVHHVTLDVVHATLPQQSVRHTIPDSTSHLETDAAISEATVNPDGTLTHWLENKTTPIPVTVPATHDTIVIEAIKEIPVTVPEPYEVERKLTWWETTCIRFAPWLLALLILTTGYIFRTPIILLARRMINCKK